MMEDTLDRLYQRPAGSARLTAQLGMVKGLPTCSTCALPPARARVQAPAERSDPAPGLGYLHPQRGGAVLLEHRVGQRLQKSILLAHQLPRERRRPLSLCRTWGSGHRPRRPRPPGSWLLRTGRRLPREDSTGHGLSACGLHSPRSFPLRTRYLPDPPADRRAAPGGQTQTQTQQVPAPLGTRPPGQKPIRNREESPPRTYWWGRPSASKSGCSDWVRMWLSRPPPLPEQRAPAP